jgi:hypothetical protein
MRLSRLVAAALAAVALVSVPHASAAGYAQRTPACSSTPLPAAVNGDAQHRTATLGSEVVGVQGAQEVSVLCRLQYDQTFSVDSPDFRIAYQRVCVGVNVCNGKSGWICVGVDVCNGNKPSHDICVGVDACNTYYRSATMFPETATFAAPAGAPLFLCSVVSWKDADGTTFYDAHDDNPQQPGAQCRLSSTA